MYQVPDYSIEPSPRRVRAWFNGEVVADSRDMVLFYRPPYPNYFFPRRDVRLDLLRESSHRRHDDPPGETLFWHLEAGGRRAENAAFTHRTPRDPAHADLSDYLTFVWQAMDHWFEEDDEVFVHARDPYHRVDAVHNSRQVEIALEGTTLASSARPVLVWETGLPTRYYLPRADVNLALLEKTDTVTRCPYKGVAETFAVRLGERSYPDYAWSYPLPIPECPRIENLICFYDEVVDVTEDGIRLPRPATHFK